MPEIHRNPEISDTEKTEVSAFKEIKPETDMTVSCLCFACSNAFSSGVIILSAISGSFLLFMVVSDRFSFNLPYPV